MIKRRALPVTLASTLLFAAPTAIAANQAGNAAQTETEDKAEHENPAELATFQSVKTSLTQAISASEQHAGGRAIDVSFEEKSVPPIKRTRLSYRSFAANAVRLQVHALAYNLGNFMRTLAMPKTAEPWSLTSLREKLIKIGAKVVSHGRYVTFQMAEVAAPRQMFAEILSLIARLQPPPAPA